MTKKFEILRVRKEYHDQLKAYCGFTDSKMYAVIEKLIKEYCNLEKPKILVTLQQPKKLSSTIKNL